VSHPLHDVRLPGPTLVLVDQHDVVAVEAVRGIDSVAGIEPKVVQLRDANEPIRGWGSVLVVAADRSRLRQLASAVPMLGQVRAVGCWLPESPVPWAFAPRPEWPDPVHLASRTTDRGALAIVRFATPARAQHVVVEMARQCAGPGRVTHGGVVVAYAGRPAAPGLDVRAPRLASVADGGDPDRDVPPDVVVAPAGASADVAAHHVIDRAPVVVADAVPDPVDERVFNPIGFDKHADQSIVDLATLRRGPGAPVTEDVVRRSRPHLGVRLDAAATVADVLSLAMAGMPMVGTSPPEVVSALAAPVAAALTAPVDLTDALRREEHSLALRRAAFDHHSTLAWRSALATRAGVRHVALPPVSVMLATKRPEMLDFALGQLARQRGADVEVVLAAHGFDPDRDAVRRVLGDRPHRVLTFAPDAFFGDVLTGAAQAASAEVLMKWDDDDWYSPDAVHDLLMARRYTGADVVGMPSEFVYLEQADVTVRRNHPTELFARFVAGGTLLLDRGLVRSLADFRRVRRYVDAQLLSAVEAAGGRIYRTHGLGYVLRRSADGHTWVRDAEDFRRPEIVSREWVGFVPPRTLGTDEMGSTTRETSGD
jgi:hypothetical protein